MSDVTPPRIELAVLGFVMDLAAVVAAAAGVPVLGAPPIALALHVASAGLCGLAFPGWRRPTQLVDATIEDIPLVPVAPLSRSGVDALHPSKAGPPPPAFAPAPEAEAPRHEHAVGFFVVGFALCLPIVGAASAVVAATLRGRGYGSFAKVVAEYRTLVESAHTVDEIASDARDQFVESTWSALELRPFVDIVSAGDAEGDLAASAIESTAVLDQLTACRLLRFALASAVPATRYYAARALARVEERLDRELERCMKLIARKPDDLLARLALARARMAYGDLAAADDPLVQLNLEEARRLLESLVGRLSGENLEQSLVSLALVSLRLGSLDRARELFDELVRRGSRTVEVYRGLAVCLHAQRDYVGLRRTLGTARLRCPDSPLVEEMCATWGVER